MSIIILIISLIILFIIVCANLKTVFNFFIRGLDNFKKIFNKNTFSLSTNNVKESISNLSIGEILKLNSINKFGFTIVLILLILFNSGFFNKYINFVFLELIIILIYLMLINLFNSEDEITRIVFGQLMTPFIALFLYLTALIKLIDNQSFKMNIFILILTFIILSLYSSIVSYYNSKEKTYKGLNLIGCICHVVFTSFILFSYIGVGFMFFDKDSFHTSTKNLFINVKGEQNGINSFGVILSYGLDKLTDSSGIQITSVKPKKEVNASELVFSIISRAFVTTYIALVFAFISNSLFSRGGKDKN